MSDTPDLRQRPIEGERTTKLPMLLGGAALLVLLLGGGLLWFVRQAIVGSEAYVTAERFVRDSGTIRGAVGDELSFGFLPTGNITSDGQSGQATLTLDVSGQKGGATLQFALVQEAGAWRIVDAAMRSPQGGVTDLVKGGRLLGRAAGPDPQSQMHVRRAQQLVEQDRVAEALAELQSARAIDSANAEAWHVQGRAMLKQEDVDSARRAFARALEIDPAHPLAHEGLGWVLQKQGSLDEALAHLDRYVELAPEEGHAWYSRGAVLYMLGRDDEALEHARRSCTLGYEPACDIRR